MQDYRYTDSYREARKAKRMGLEVTLSAHGWVIWGEKGLIFDSEGHLIGEKSMSDREFLAPLLGE